ncbi:MAG TPA: glycosyltransferase family 2 protein [Prolixibacteraceae bacterium]|nr:glycosyltransferase family 2 protein [Prolixibacteraceae bacterium]HRV90176.1 glycosyltransferase family 2 protein [Prolixibacteraceae bacterium]
MKALTIVVPVYNEVKNIERVTTELGKYMEKSVREIRILFVNDGSTDGSQELIEKACAENKGFSFIEFCENRGLTTAIKAGFDHVETPLAGYIDADLQTDPEDFDLLLEYADEYEIVTGIRTGRKDSIVKKVSSLLANKIRRAFTHDGMDDTGCPLKVIHTDVARQIPMFKGLHRFLPAMVLLLQGKIKQVPVRHYPRMAGESKFGLFNRLWGPLIDCFAYLWMKKKFIRYQIKRKS